MAAPAQRFMGNDPAYSWQSLLHRDLLSESQSYLTQTETATEDEKCVLVLGIQCLKKKILCQNIPLPSDHKIKEIFERVVLEVIQRAAVAMIQKKEEKCATETIRWRGVVEDVGGEKKGSPEMEAGDSLAAVLGKKVSDLENEIGLLKEWHGAPLRVFTDPLDII